MKQSLLLERLRREVLILDGSMGALLQGRGLPPGYAPDLWNLERPQVIEAVHREYVEAGADILLTNTFGASRLRLGEYGASERVREINLRAVELARRAGGGRVFVAGDVGPSGTTIAPFGELPFDEAVAIFAEQIRALVEGGVDLIAIETMFDLQEIRAAVLAAREVAPHLPLMALMTFTGDGLTDTGTDPETAAVVLDGLHVDILGVNCSTGPEPMVEVVARMGRVTDTLLCVQPNAGLPINVDGRPVFPATAEEVAAFAEAFVEAGANIVGGCCGTTPEYIRLLAQRIKGKPPVSRSRPSGLWIASRMQTVAAGERRPFLKIGEKINPTGRKAFAEAIRQGRLDLILQEARKQAEHGAMALDVNVGVPLTDEAANMARAVTAIQNVVSLPLVIDSSEIPALEAGLKVYPGKALVNSVNGEEERLERILPLVRRYGAAVIGLLSGDEIPERATDRLRIAERILERALALGLRKEDVIFDCLALTVSAMPEASRETLETIRLVRQHLGCPTILGVSNVSFGLPHRKRVHNTFLAMAIGMGLDAAILNPYDPELHQTVAAASLFAARDPDCRTYIELQALLEPQETRATPTRKPAKSIRDQIFEAVVEGDRDGIEALVRQGLAEGLAPLEIFTEIMTPAIRHLGDLFAQRKKFIPHLVASADTMKRGMAVLTPLLEQQGDMEKKGTIIMATVKGDIHDIGKNICCLMLRNFGYNVIDLGRNVPCEAILEAAERYKADIIGLSALMTTTMMQMKVVRDAVRERGLPYKIMIGGAVTTRRFAQEIGVDGYGRDVGDVVPVADGLMEGRTVLSGKEDEEN